ncbi:MAG TPA: hypothetical protein VF881_10975 [Polyangiaceae bacterium]
MRPDAIVARRFLVAGATMLPIGIALSAVGQSDIGSLVTIGGLAAIIAGLHTFGRAGPDKGA